MKNIIRLTVVMEMVFLLTAAAVYGQARPPQKPPVITSGRGNTLGKFSFQYGRLEISAKLPRTANGLWPAFWLLGADFKESGWPDCGEIDLMEMGHVSGFDEKSQAKLYSGAAHWGPVQQDGSHPNYTIFKTNSYALQYGDFHLFTLIWDDQYIRMYLDLDKLPEEQRPLARPYFEMKINIELEKYFRKPFSIIMNLAAGGTYTGIFGRENTNQISALNKDNNYQASMYIDFVRVYDLNGNLIFSDEFNGSGIDATKWNIEENDNGGGNQELQSYRRQNVRVGQDRVTGKGCLIITAKRE